MNNQWKDVKQKIQQITNKAKELAKQIRKKPVNTLIRISTSHPIKAIMIVILITIAIIPGIMKIELDNNIRGFLGGEFDTIVETDYIEDMFHISKSIFFLTVESENIYTSDTLKYMRFMHNQLSAKPEDIDGYTIDERLFTKHDTDFDIHLYKSPESIDSITINGLTHEKTKAVTKSMIKEISSIINAVDATSDGQSLETFDFIEKRYDPISNKYQRMIPTSQAELERLKTLLEDNKEFEGLYYSQKRTEEGLPASWIFSVEIENDSQDDYYDVINYIEETIEKTSNYGYKTKFFGVDYTNKAVNEESREDAKRQLIIVVLVIMFVFFLNFRTPSGVFIPEISTIISVSWIYGLMGYFGIKLSIIGLGLIPLLFAITSSYSIHSLNQYYKEIKPDSKDKSINKMEKSKKIADSMTHILTTIAIAGLTTFISLISLIGSNIIHIKTFGIFAGLGVIVSVILSITFIPAILTIVPHKRVRKKEKDATFDNSIIDRFVQMSTSYIIKHRYLFFIIFLVFAIVFILGMYFINTDSSFVKMFDPDHRIRELSKHFSEHTGGVSSMLLTIDAAPHLDTSIMKSIDNGEPIETIPDKTQIREKTNDPFIDEQNTETLDYPFIDDDKIDDPFSDDDTTKTLDDPFSDDNTTDYNTIIDTEELFGEEEEDSVIMPEEKLTNHALDSDLLQKVDEMKNYFESVKGIGRVYSYADIIKRLNYIYNGKTDKKRFYRIPDTDKQIMNYQDIFSGDDENEDGVIDSIETLVDPLYNKINIILTLSDKGDIVIDTGDYERIEDELQQYWDKYIGLASIIRSELNLTEKEPITDKHIDKYINGLTSDSSKNIVIENDEINNLLIDVLNIQKNQIKRDELDELKNIPLNIEYYITGWSIIYKDVQREIVRGQLISIIFSFFFIFLIVALLFRSVIGGLISIIPLSASILVTLGLMGYTAIPLNIATSLISAVAIGISVDDTIHYMLHLKKFKRESSNDESIESLIYKTSSFTGKAIIFTSLALIFGFLVLHFSTFIPIRHLAYLTAFTLFIATIATLWGLPSILLIFPRLVGVKKKEGKYALSKINNNNKQLL
jgi:predicted RND superfamily exporter protein